eukprot:804043-Ditylum_brightwellii.AAC.1
MGWEAGVPSSTRIVEDIVRITEYSILKRFYVRGVVVHGCGTHRGHRQDGTRKAQNWGGCRDKKISDAFIHSNALSVLNESLQSNTAT